MTELARRVYAFMSEHCRGAENRLPRRRICQLLGCSDRQFRRACEEIRTEMGEYIGGSSSLGGYFLASTPGEAEMLRGELVSRIRSLARQTRQLERRFNLPQLQLLEVEA